MEDANVSLEVELVTKKSQSLTKCRVHVVRFYDSLPVF